MDWKLELVMVPVSDMDRALEFYETRAGFTLNVDHRIGEDFRVVQLTPPGSACSINLLKNETAGSLHGLHVVVADIEAAIAELRGRGVDVTGPFHFGPSGQTDGLHATRGDYETFASFEDPDGNGWLLQEVPSRAAD